MESDRVPLDRWEGEPVERWRERWGLPSLEIYDRVGSTNDIARDRAAEDAPEGTVVIAREQVAGRGRRGRVWTAPPGSSLLLSMIVRPRLRGVETILTLRLGVAAARAAEEASGLGVDLKWPNDLLISGRKLGGILCEAAFEAGRPLYVIAGIGINLQQGDDDWPPDLAGTATSLAAHHRPVQAATLAGHLVAEWTAVLDNDARTLSDAEMREVDRRDILRGRRVAVDGTPAGVAAGVAPDGALLVDAGHGPRRLVSGTVRPLDAEMGESP